MTPSSEAVSGTVAFWERRHQQQGDLRSGGHIGLDAQENEIFYAVRLGQLLRIVGSMKDGDHPLSVLDVGCGKGYFSDFLARVGHHVVGVDPSQQAIEHCREHRLGRYEVASAAAFRSPWLFDVVYAIDVLFHVLDDDEWESSLRNLASLVRIGGRLAVTDRRIHLRQTAGDYIVFRPQGWYYRILEERGLRFDGFRSYAFRENDIGFFVFTRTG